MELNKLPKIRGTYRINADLSKTNWFNVGGKAEILYRPADIKDLQFFLKNKPQELKVTILGVGSNLLVRDGGIDGVVIKLGRGFASIDFQGDLVTAGAGALGYNVAISAASKAIGGLEFLSGIPGTIGGALAMNAGAYDNETCAVLQKAIAIDSFGNLHNLNVGDIGYVYRGNTLPEGMIFVEGTFKGYYSKTSIIKARIDEITKKRSETQPVKTRTSGSTFKNPLGEKAWKLIDDAGCRGLKIGGAQVSEKHCNFFINTGSATAQDIEDLGEEVRRRVKDNSGIDLHWEVQIIGKKND
jgi:UDP-N-acetylmuramate dehydrogenase